MPKPKASRISYKGSKKKERTIQINNEYKVSDSSHLVESEEDKVEAEESITY